MKPQETSCIENTIKTVTQAYDDNCRHWSSKTTKIPDPLRHIPFFLLFLIIVKQTWKAQVLVSKAIDSIFS